MMEPPVVTQWTGQLALNLQQAMRATQEQFAERLGVAHRTVSKWKERPTVVPQAELQQALDTLLESSGIGAQARFAALRDESASSSDVDMTALQPALRWLADQCAWPVSPANAVRAQCAQPPRPSPDQRGITAKLHDYYGSGDSMSPLELRYKGELLRPLAVAAEPAWLEPRALSRGSEDHKRHWDAPPATIPWTSELQHAVAVKLAEVIRNDQRFYEGPLYRLTKIEWPNLYFDVGSFTSYALSWDTLENENDISGSRLRKSLLPDLASIRNVGERHCCGGVATLTAIARSRGDYLLLVQERSQYVINRAGLLAIIPKAFHESSDGTGTDVSIWKTVLREIQEELMGREDVDMTQPLYSSVVDPYHPDLQAEPLGALLADNSKDCTMMQTGLGLNLAHGGYEIATMVASHDERWWSRFGGHLKANWEASRIRQYSSMDVQSLEHLLTLPNWTDESLFSLVLGLKELARIDPDRVAINPEQIEVAVK